MDSPSSETSRRLRTGPRAPAPAAAAEQVLQAPAAARAEALEQVGVRASQEVASATEVSEEVVEITVAAAEVAEKVVKGILGLVLLRRSLLLVQTVLEVAGALEAHIGKDAHGDQRDREHGHRDLDPGAAEAFGRLRGRRRRWPG